MRFYCYIGVGVIANNIISIGIIIFSVEYFESRYPLLNLHYRRNFYIP